MILFRTTSQIRTLLFRRFVAVAGVLVVVVLVPLAAHAAASPWENAVTALETSFTGPIARGLSLVAIVWGGLTFAFSEGGDSKRMLAGILFGVGMAIGAVNFMLWLFP
jgi:type IV secretory pathway VirB2 component (pilin)